MKDRKEYMVEQEKKTIVIGNPTLGKYHKKFETDDVIVYIDVYGVLELWKVSCPALQHALKKFLQPGNRGHKGKLQDLTEGLESARAGILMEAVRDE